MYYLNLEITCPDTMETPSIPQQKLRIKLRLEKRFLWIFSKKIRMLMMILETNAVISGSSRTDMRKSCAVESETNQLVAGKFKYSYQLMHAPSWQIINKLNFKT